MSRAREGGARGGAKSKGGDCSPPHAMFYGFILSVPTAGRARGFGLARKTLAFWRKAMLMQRLALS
jgi:hypothetical protein